MFSETSLGNAEILLLQNKRWNSNLNVRQQLERPELQSHEMRRLASLNYSRLVEGKKIYWDFFDDLVQIEQNHVYLERKNKNATGSPLLRTCHYKNSAKWGFHRNKMYQRLKPLGSLSAFDLPSIFCLTNIYIRGEHYYFCHFKIRLQ